MVTMMYEEVFEDLQEGMVKGKKQVAKSKEKSLREIMNRTHFNKYELEEYMTDSYE